MKNNASLQLRVSNYARPGSKLSLLVILALLLAQCILAIKAQPSTLPGRIAALPRAEGNIAIPIDQLDRTDEEHFLLAYEIQRQESVQALGTNYPVTLHGVNHSYAALMNLNLLNGSFFTKTAQKAAERYAVLGEGAANRIFGSVNITGETMRIGHSLYNVIGVVEDCPSKEVESHVYIPLTCMENETVSGAIALTGADITRDHVQTELREAGIQKEGFYMVDVGRAGELIWERTLFAAMLLGCCGAVWLTVWSTRTFVENMRAFRNALQHAYPGELLRRQPSLLVRMAVLSATMLAGIGTILWLLTRALGLLLDWGSAAKDLRNAAVTLFAGRLEPLREYLRTSDLLFVLTMGMFILWVVALLLAQWRQKHTMCRMDT